MNTLDGVDLTDASQSSPAVQGIIYNSIASDFNKKNEKCKQAFDSYNQGLEEMNTLTKQFVNSRKVKEGFTPTNDNNLSNEEVINSIIQRSDDTTGALDATTRGLTDVSNSTYQNNINLLEQKERAIQASSKAVDDYYKYSKNEFDNNFSEENELKNKIMTSDRIINIQEEEYENKVFYSSLFAYFLIYLIAVWALFKARQALGMSYQVFGGIWSAFTFILILMIVRRWLERNNKLFKIEHSVSQAIKDLKNDTLAGFVDELLGPCKTCPDGSTAPSSSDRPNINPNTGATGLEMRTDLTTNVWIDGDQTGTVGIKPAYPGLPTSILTRREYNDDETLSMVDNDLVYYNCYWDGRQNSGINPQQTELKTTVPCEYLPGYSYYNTGLENNSGKYDNN